MSSFVVDFDPVLLVGKFIVQSLASLPILLPFLVKPNAFVFSIFADFFSFPGLVDAKLLEVGRSPSEVDAQTEVLALIVPLGDLSSCRILSEIFP